MKHSMSKRAGYCPEVDRGLTWIVTGQPSVDFIALNQIGNGCESVQRVPMIRIPVVGSLRNGRAGCNGPDRNGSRAAEPNEFDAGNVRSPDRGTRGGERRVEDPGGGSGSAAADQLAEPFETTINGQPATRSLRGEVETETRRAGRPPRTDPGPAGALGRKHRALARRIHKRETDYLKFAHKPGDTVHEQLRRTRNPDDQDPTESIRHHAHRKRRRTLRRPPLLPTNHRETRHTSAHSPHPADQPKPLAIRLPLTSYRFSSRERDSHSRIPGTPICL